MVVIYALYITFMTALIYFHGFCSAYQQNSYDKLTPCGCNVYYPSYEPHDVDKTIAFMSEYIPTIKNKHTNVILFGNSLGGLWADYFGRLYQLPVILNNPAIELWHSLAQFIGEQNNYVTDTKFTLTRDHLVNLTALTDKRHNLPNTPRIVFINKDDEIVPYHYSVDEFTNNSTVTIFAKGGHRLVRYPEVFDAVKSFMLKK